MQQEFTSYRRWSDMMSRRADSPGGSGAVGMLARPDPRTRPRAGRSGPDPTRDTWSTLRVTRMVTPAQLTGRCWPRSPRCRCARVSAAATAMTVASWRRARQQDPGAAVAPFRSVITGLREVPNDGVDYGLLRYVGRVPELDA